MVQEHWNDGLSGEKKFTTVFTQTGPTLGQTDRQTDKQCQYHLALAGSHAMCRAVKFNTRDTLGGSYQCLPATDRHTQAPQPSKLSTAGPPRLNSSQAQYAPSTQIYNKPHLSRRCRLTSTITNSSNLYGVSRLDSRGGDSQRFFKAGRFASVASKPCG